MLLSQSFITKVFTAVGKRKFDILLREFIKEVGTECRVLKGAGSQLVVSVCQHTLAG